MGSLWQDLRHGSRLLYRRPGLSAAIVVTVGLGVGGSASIFGALKGVLLTPLPYRDPGRLVSLRESNPQQATGPTGASAGGFVDWRELSRSFDGLAAYRPWGFILTGEGDPERVLGARVSANLFGLLGSDPLLGRVFLPDEDRVGKPKAVLVSEELWRRRYGSDASLVGKSIRLDGVSHTVVGIVPAGHQLPAAQLWVPLVFAPYELDQRGTRALSVVARLAPGSSVAAAGANMAAVAAELERRYPDANAGWGVTVTPLQEEITGSSRTPLLVLFAAVTSLLLVACIHLAILLLARLAGRRRELAVRAALGAGRGRILQLLLAENVLATLAGGAFGLAIAVPGTAGLAHLGPAYLPRSAEIRIDAVVVAFGVAVALATGAGLAGIAALGATRVPASEALGHAVSGLARRSRFVPRDLALVAQFALTLVLLATAGLLGRSWWNLRSVELGFSPPQVLATTISLANARYSGPEQQLAFYRELLPRIEADPELRAAALVSHLPLVPGALSADLAVEGRPPPSGGALPMVEMNNVSGSYFGTIGIRLLGGRTFADSDRTGAAPVVIVDEPLARRLWGGSEAAIGRRVRLGSTIGADPAWREVVGVVAGVRSASLEAGPTPLVYVPYTQNPWPTMNVVVRATGDPARLAERVRRAVLHLDPEQPVYAVRTLEEVLAGTLASRRLQVVLLGGFAAAAMLLATLGIYAVFAHAVARRKRELAVRIALGGLRSDLQAFVLGRALRSMAGGLLLGWIGTLASSRWLSALVFGVSPHDPATLLGAALLLAAAGLVASCLPARRAANLDPIEALRSE